jgi:two-component system, OmpR family, phosphate regulon response regulator PhoB
MPSPEDDEVRADAPGYALVPERFAVHVAGRAVVVTPTQFRLLAALLAGPGRTFSRADLVARAFPTTVEERTVDVHIKELRRKLEPHNGRTQTARGQGYRYEGTSMTIGSA